MHSHTPFVLDQRSELKFTFDNTTEYWFGGDVVLTHFFNALSIFGPEAERFLIKVLRSLKGDVKDQKLLADCDGFIRQEAMHSRVHTDFNKHIASFGYDMERIETVANGCFDELYGLEPRYQLDIVRAAEHLIYDISMLVLKTEKYQNMMEPEVARMFNWHAMEEIEHASVAHDLSVYLYGESYVGRIKGVMKGASVIMDRVYRIYWALMEKSIADGAISVGQARLGWLKLCLPWGAIGKFVTDSLGYLNPSFRPWHNFARDEGLLMRTEHILLKTNIK